MLYDLPIAITLCVNIGETAHCFARCTIGLQSKSVDTGMNRNLTQVANIGFVDDALRLPLEEINEVIAHFGMIMPHIIGQCRQQNGIAGVEIDNCCLLYTSPSPRDKRQSRMPSSA